MVDRYEHLHPVMVTQLLEVPSTENVAADGPVAHHHVALARRARHRRPHFDYFDPLPVTPRGSTYILLFTDRFSRRADMCPATAAEFTAEGTANILKKTVYSPLGLPAQHPLRQRPPALLQAFASRISSRGSNTCHHSYHPNCNGGVERVNHTMAQMLAMWSSTSSKTTGMSSSLTLNLRTTIPSAPPRVRLPTRYIRVGCHASLLRFSSVLESPATRAWPATTSPILRLGDGPPAARVRYRSRTPRPHCRSREPPQIRPRRRSASSPPQKMTLVGRTIRRPPFARARNPTRTPRPSRPNSPPTGRAPTKGSQLAPAPQRTPRTDLLSGPSVKVLPTEL